MRFFYILLTIPLFLIGCDSDAQVNIYDKSLTTNRVKCLSYTPDSNSTLESKLGRLYKFNSNCPYKIKLSYKSGIKCNSSFNAVQKATSNFPTAYIKLEVYKGLTIKYSYYKDLTSKPNISDIDDAFNRLKDDIL